jgi:outer membrane protein assembly factor BamB
MEPLADVDPRTVGEFRLLARLGSGGMGQVFLATSPAGRMVAVKIIHPELGRDPSFVSRFRGEVAAARMVSGLFTAPVVAAGVDESPLWLATAFVPGPSLDGIVTRHGPLPVPALWRLAAGLAEALLAIHSAGLVHRDLKPENVLLALDGPRVIDFGISRVLTDARLTGTGMVMGTPAYMSPEQVEGLASGPPGDVFSLGSVLAFASSGTSPFSSPGMSPASVFYRIVHAQPELKGVPAEVHRLLAACLAKDSGQRPGLRQVAALGATQAEYLGLSPASFWPPDMAQAIQAQQEAAAAEIQGLLITTPVRGMSWNGGEADTAKLWGGAVRLGSRAGGSSPVHPAVSGYPGGSGEPTAFNGNSGGNGSADVRTQEPGAAGSRPADGRYAATGTGGVSRRGLLIGAGAAGVAVIGGLAGWKLATDSSSSARDAAGHSGAAGARNTARAGRPGRARAATGTGSAAAPAGSTLPQFAHLASGQRAWSFQTDGAVEGNPTVAGSVAYVASDDGRLYAVNVGNGLLAWSCQVPDVTAAPTVAAGVVCAAGPPPGISIDTRAFYAINASSGTLAWQMTIEFTGLDSAQNWAIDGSNVIVPTNSGNLQTYDAATGAAGMTYTTPQGFSGTIVAVGGIIYAIDLGGTLYAISASSGITQWHATLLQDGPGGASLVFADDTVYVGAGTGGTLFSLNAGTGSINWAHEVDPDLSSAPVIAAGVVYLVTSSGLLQAYAATDCSKLWSAQVGETGPDGASPAVADGRVYVCADLELLSLDATSGKQLWSFPLPGTVFGSNTPAVGDGLVFFGCEDKNLYAVRA